MAAKSYSFIKLFFMFFVVVLLFEKAGAWPPTYGAEFEVTRDDLEPFDPKKDVASETNVKKAQMLFVEEMVKRCKISKCRIQKVEASWDQDYKVIYPDGWWFKISYDPACVEFTFKPSTLEELKKQAPLINDQIFQTAKDLGFRVQEGGVAHVNIGVRSSFGDDPKKFLRFFVDYANHADLALGSLGKDIYKHRPYQFWVKISARPCSKSSMK